MASRKPKALEPHPLSNLLPMMSEDELRKLRADILEVGPGDGALLEALAQRAQSEGDVTPERDAALECLALRMCVGGVGHAVVDLTTSNRPR